jgi:hypothetical protein
VGATPTVWSAQMRYLSPTRDRVVWVVDPAARTVTAYCRDVEPQVYREEDTLTVDHIIPGFQLFVRNALRE